MESRLRIVIVQHPKAPPHLHCLQVTSGLIQKQTEMSTKSTTNMAFSGRLAIIGGGLGKQHPLSDPANTLTYPTTSRRPRQHDRANPALQGRNRRPALRALRSIAHRHSPHLNLQQHLARQRHHRRMRHHRRSLRLRGLLHHRRLRQVHQHIPLHPRQRRGLRLGPAAS